MWITGEARGFLVPWWDPGTGPNLLRVCNRNHPTRILMLQNKLKKMKESEADNG